METKYGFTKMTISEFENWISRIRVGRTILKIQQHHTYIPSYIHFTGTNHFERQLAMKNHHVNQNGWRDIGQHFHLLSTEHQPLPHRFKLAVVPLKY